VPWPGGSQRQHLRLDLLELVGRQIEPQRRQLLGRPRWRLEPVNPVEAEPDAVGASEIDGVGRFVHDLVAGGLLIEGREFGGVGGAQGHGGDGGHDGESNGR
jgi:hypothetical protein